MAEKENLDEEVQALISEIQEACRDGQYVFRGINISKDKDGRPVQVSSHIYRRYEQELIFRANFQPVDIEEDIVERARAHFSPSVSNAEILTDLRHFGADTTLIDFSYNLFVALFFACNGEFDKDGVLIAFPTDDRDPLADISYGERKTEIALLRPARTELSRARAEFQSSIFVHAPEGNIPEGRYRPFSVGKRLKETCLKFLRDFHNIHQRTVFNDLIGFIDNRENFQPAELWFYRGLQAQGDGNHEDAIDHYGKALDLQRDHAKAYFGRGMVKKNRGNHEGAIKDLDEVIRLVPELYEAYLARGEAKESLGRHDDAIKDLDEVIRLKPELAKAYLVRGVVKEKLGHIKKALGDCNEALRLKPEFPEAYFYRGIIKKELGQMDEAGMDLEKTIELADKRGNQKFAKEARRQLSALKDYPASASE